MQALPHLPQLLLSVVVSVQVEPHSTSPLVQVLPQAPPEQTSPAGHLLPQAPQLLGSFEVLSQPPAAVHWVVPEGQEVPQAPATQASPDAHTLPHAPQFEASVWTSMHFPLQLF